MWFWIIVIACVIGAIIGMVNSDSDAAEGAASGAFAGGCLAVGCLARLAIAALAIFLVIWLFGLIFG